MPAPHYRAGRALAIYALTEGRAHLSLFGNTTRRLAARVGVRRGICWRGLLHLAFNRNARNGLFSLCATAINNIAGARWTYANARMVLNARCSPTCLVPMMRAFYLYCYRWPLTCA